MDLHTSVRKYKLYLLQDRYKCITNYIICLQNHINNIYHDNFIDQHEKTQVLGTLLQITKTLNSKYNNFINQELDKETNYFLKIDSLIKSFDETINEENIYQTIKNYECIPKYKKHTGDILPLEYYYQQIYQTISKYGINSLKNILIFSLHECNYNLLDKSVIDLVDELEQIVVPLSFDFFDVSDKIEQFYWRTLTNFPINDNLELSRELWIKNPTKENNYLKITLYFKIDTLSSYIKTCQIKYPYLYQNKSNILNRLENDNTDIDQKFIKTFIRHNYLGNIYSMDEKEYVDFVRLSYFKYIELIDTTFINLMKDFISKNNSIKNMHEVIFLLLLGNDDSTDIAGLLFGLIKEKKNNSQYLYNYLYNNLTYYLQVKIKKSSNNLKEELERLKSLNVDDLDLKKQLIANKFIPDNVKSLVVEKIEEMKSFNNEYFKQLTFVKTIINFPWPSLNEDIFYNSLNNDKIKAKKYITDVEKKLKQSSYGHHEAKKLLLQVIGKWVSNPDSRGTCFGLVGPPGVGKTLLAKSVSKALDIPFSQITLGGQNDGELLHGHGYTYSGSQPGMIIKKMVEMGKSRCILYFDELDKACSKHGHINEITSILIHLTDPNMNKTFQDRFFQGINFPLDKVIMIFSYNDSSLVDPILLDRIKEINVLPYTLTDKINICKHFIIPEIRYSVSLENENLCISDNLIEYIIDNYTSEAGVRGIKRHLENIFLHINLDFIYSRGVFSKKKKTISITKKEVLKIISEPKIDHVTIHPKNEIGIVNGLYATTNGDGGIIPIQIFKNYTSINNQFELKLTGKQGDVMKESVQCSLTAALGYINRHINKYNFVGKLEEYMNSNFKYGFHVHTPSTSVSKDGPSAGCAFTTSFISRILNKPIKNNIAMTGEVELTGKITKIGGLNYKLIGAKRAGVKIVYVPKENKKDLAEIKKTNPKLINKEFKVKIFDYIDEIIDNILVSS